MPVTYKLISTVTVSTATAANIEFTSIPGTYDDLIIFASLRGNTAQIYEIVNLEFNGLSTNLSSRGLEGNGATASSYSNPTIYINAADGANATASTFSNHFIYIPNYAGSTNKSVSVDGVMENNATTAYASLQAGLWSQTAAITSIKIKPTGSFVQYSTATLYGIKKS